MDIQREMRAVKGDVVFKCDQQLMTQRASYRLQPGPEQSVMHDQKISLSLCSLRQNARRNINRRSDARDTTGIFDLQTIKRIVPIANVTNAQILVGVTDNLGKRRHSTQCRGVCLKRRGKTNALAAASVSTGRQKKRREDAYALPSCRKQRKRARSFRTKCCGVAMHPRIASPLVAICECGSRTAVLAAKNEYGKADKEPLTSIFSPRVVRGD